MAKAWQQFIVLATCTLAVGSAIASLANAAADSTKPLVPNTQVAGRKQAAADLQLAASSSDFSHAQPNVYHSIIDRSLGAGLDHQKRSTGSSPVQSSANSDADLSTAAGHHHGHAHGKYYEYREVPKKKTWKYGYKRGNHKHTIERHEHGQAGKHPHFKTKVKWQDKKSKGKGIHLWDYNHHDKKHGYHG